MIKQKSRPSEVSLEDNGLVVGHFSHWQTIWNCLFWAVVIFAILFRIYKAHNAGVIYDEVWTYEKFCTSLRTAVTKYHTNNHILNSVCIVIAEKLFGWYEHFLRIPSVISGIVFCCASAAILQRTVKSICLQITGAAFMLLNWFIFDLSYLGRGYAIALGAVFAGILVFLHFSTKELTIRQRWLLSIFFVIVNVTAMGSMLSSLPIVLSLNSVFAIWLLLKAIQKSRKDVLIACAMLFVLAAATCILLLILYNNVIADIRYFSKHFEVADSFGDYMKQILWGPLIYLDLSQIHLNSFIYKAFITISLFCLVICSVKLILLFKNVQSISKLLINPSFIVIALFIETCILMWMQRVIFDVSLGMNRNGVFLLVLMLMAAVIIMDKAAGTIAHIPAFSKPLYTVCILVIISLTYFNWPSSCAVDVQPRGWAVESSIGPLARILKKIDPYKKWRIKLERYTMDTRRPIRYYQGRGYDIEFVEDGVSEISILLEAAPSSQFVYINYNRFIEHHCCILVNPASFNDSPVFYQVSPVSAVKKEIINPKAFGDLNVN